MWLPWMIRSACCPVSFHFQIKPICRCFALPCSTVCGFAPNLGLIWKRNQPARQGGRPQRPGQPHPGALSAHHGPSWAGGAHRRSGLSVRCRRSGAGRAPVGGAVREGANDFAGGRVAVLGRSDAGWKMISCLSIVQLCDCISSSSCLHPKPAYKMSTATLCHESEAITSPIKLCGSMCAYKGFINRNQNWGL